MAMVDLLVITTLFPNPVQSRHGIFVETRLRHLTSGGDVGATVIAPVPWFPFKWGVFQEYSKFRNIPQFERRGNIDVHHPQIYCDTADRNVIDTIFFGSFHFANAQKIGIERKEF